MSAVPSQNESSKLTSKLITTVEYSTFRYKYVRHRVAAAARTSLTRSTAPSFCEEHINEKLFYSCSERAASHVPVGRSLRRVCRQHRPSTERRLPPTPSTAATTATFALLADTGHGCYVATSCPAHWIKHIMMWSNIELSGVFNTWRCVYSR